MHDVFSLDCCFWFGPDEAPTGGLLLCPEHCQAREGDFAQQSLAWTGYTCRLWRVTGACAMHRFSPPAEATVYSLRRLSFGAQLCNPATDNYRNQRTNQQANRKKRQAGLKAVGSIVLQPAHGKRADKTAKIADRIDERDPACRRNARKITGWHCPKHRLRGIQSDCSHRYRHHGEQRRSGISAADKPDACQSERPRAMPDALSSLIRMA